jgi:hypothetical protein
MFRRAIDDFDGEVRRGFLDRDGQRQADITTAGDQDVEHGGFGHGVLLDA